MSEQRESTHAMRFSSWGRAQSAGIVIGLLVLVVLGLRGGSHSPENYQSDDPAQTNVALYRAIVHHMDDGDSYYEAVDASQAVRGFPTRPFPTVREPGLASVQSWLGGSRPMGLVLLALLSVTLLATVVRLERMAPNRLTFWAASLLCLMSPVVFLNQQTADLHEYWAGLLVALSLAVHSATRWRAPIVIALLAVLVRELALPLLVVMAAYEFMLGCRRRAAAWVAAATAFFVLLAVHAWRVEQGITPASVHSPGWIKVGGWPFFVDAARYTSFLMAFPLWVGAVAVPLALVGWLSRRGDFADPVLLVLFTYAAALLVVGRPGNTYWGFLFVTMLMPGLAFAPSALATLGQNIARRGRRSLEPLEQSS